MDFDTMCSEQARMFLFLQAARAHSHFPGTVYNLLILLAQAQIDSGIISL